MAHHTIPTRVYYTIFFTLMVLTGLTVWVAFQDLGAWNDVVALSIATLKATLVILYFMHVRYSSKLTHAFIVAGFLFLVILLAITMSDYLTRDTLIAPKAWDLM